jgi:hypothetical protein
MRSADSPLLRLLLALCVIAQVATVLVRSGDRVLCFGGPELLSRVCAERLAAGSDEYGGEYGTGEHRTDCHHHDEHHHHDDHHASVMDTALPHDHEHPCDGCVDVRMPDDPTRTDKAQGVPAMPPPALIAIIDLPIVAPSTPQRIGRMIAERGIPPATGLVVTRLRV